MYKNILQQYLVRHQREPFHRELRKLISLEDLTKPFSTLPTSSCSNRILCSIITKSGKTVAILPSGESMPDIEGVGRTNLLLRLLGVSIPYGRFLERKAEELKEIPWDIPIEYKRKDVNLISSDMAHLCVSDGELNFLPIIGEAFSFIWDLTRHIFRMSTLFYKTGEHRTQRGRERLNEILMHLSIPVFKTFLGRINRAYSPNQIIILRRNIDDHAITPDIRELTGKERKQRLLKAFLSCTHHGSSFWTSDRYVARKNITAICKSIDWDRLCPVHEIVFSYPFQAIPQHVYDAIEILVSNQLRGGSHYTTDLITRQGIGYHNDILLRCIPDVDEVKILALSGEKLFRDIAFWETLFLVERPFILNILLLNPHSSRIQVLEKQLYPDKPVGFLLKEIVENCETIKRMANAIKPRGSQVSIKLSTYCEEPSFRLTFIGPDRLLFASYTSNMRTGTTTQFCDLVGYDGIIKSFNREFEKIEKRSAQYF